MASNSYGNETELIAACLAGDATAWDQFATQYRRLIRTTAARIRSRYQTASTDTDDLESYVYQRLLEDDRRRIRAWQGRARFSTYLVQVARNLIMDYYALRNQRPIPEDYQAHVEGANQAAGACDQETYDERKAALQLALEKLPPKHALILRLRLEGKTLSDIAAITNRPLGTISVENSRAMERIRSAMTHLINQSENGG